MKFDFGSIACFYLMAQLAMANEYFPCVKEGFAVALRSQTDSLFYVGVDDGEIVFTGGETQTGAYCSTAACSGQSSGFIAEGQTDSAGVQTLELTHYITGSINKFQALVQCADPSYTMTVTDPGAGCTFIGAIVGSFADLGYTNCPRDIAQTVTLTCTPPTRRLSKSFNDSDGDHRKLIWDWLFGTDDDDDDEEGNGGDGDSSNGCTNVYTPSEKFLLTAGASSKGIGIGPNDGDLEYLLVPGDRPASCNAKGCVGNNFAIAAPGNDVATAKTLTVTLQNPTNSAGGPGVVCPLRTQTMTLSHSTTDCSDYSDFSSTVDHVGVLAGECNIENTFTVVYVVTCTNA